MNTMTSCRALTLCLVVLGAGSFVKAAESDRFTTQLSEADFTGAGLGKLTPTERARLDALVKAYESRELAGVRTAAARAEAERAAVEAKVAAAGSSTVPTAEKAKTSWLRRITLNPGTTVEYETVETELVGPFSGWRSGTVFTLGNGQKWQVVAGEYPSPTDLRPRRVKISPGMLGSFFLQIDGVNPRAKVRFVGTTD